MDRLRLNLFLAVVVVALAGGAWIAQRHKNEAKPKLTPLAVQDIHDIRIEWPGAPAIHLEKQKSGWMLTAPVQGRADPFEVAGATSIAATEVQSTVDSVGLNAKEIGLDPPDHVVSFNNVKLEFGATEPLQSFRYVRVQNAVQLIDDPAPASLDKNYADLVAKELFGKDDTLVKIELPGLTLTQNDKGAWQAPAGTANATPAALAHLADGWKTARAMWNEAAPGDTPKGDAVRITLKDGRVVDFIVAATAPQFALYSPALKIRYQLSKALEDELLKLPAPKPAADAAKPATAPSEVLPSPLSPAVQIPPAKY